MASLVKREDREGVWYIQYRVGGEIKRRSTGTENKSLPS
jgi:hypothetical protein